MVPNVWVTPDKAALEALVSLPAPAEIRQYPVVEWPWREAEFVKVARRLHQRARETSRDFIMRHTRRS